MRIKFAGHGLPQRTGETGLRHMLALLAEQKTLTALITKVSPRSVVLEIEHTEIKLPLSAFTPSMVVEALAPGRMMEIERRGETLSFAFVRSRPTTLAEPAEPPTLSSLAEHLPALGIAPGEHAVLAAEALLQNGYPLDKELVLALLPWAERGELAEALILLRARFPLKPELLQAARDLVAQTPAAERIAAANDLPADLRRDLARPTLENRTAWSGRFREGETFKALCRLLVQERLLEALAVRAGGKEQIFALPFVLADGLYACWLRFAFVGDGRDGDETHGERNETPLSIELEIPTLTLGVVGVRLIVAGHALTLSLRVEGEEPAFWRGAVQALKEELAADGWQLGAVDIKEWCHAKSSRFTL